MAELNAEDALLGRAVDGDIESLTRLLEDHGHEIRRRIDASLGKAWRTVVDADDVMQVTYLEAFLRIRQFKPSGPGSFAAWLMRIAENNLRDAVRELERAKRPDPRRRAEVTSDQDSCLALVEMIGYTSTTPSRDVARSEAVRMLESSLRALPADYEQVLRLYDLSGRPVDEVAAALGRSPGAVHMLRARAQERLREVMGTYSQFFTRV
jgi:RNA polymerase sigma-70 factor (ECF subfamily)